MEIFLIIIALVVGYVLGQAITIIRVKGIIKDAALAEGIDLDEEVKKEQLKHLPTIYKLEIETVNNILYLFDKETRDFVCQGSTIEELAKLSKEYKNINMASVTYGKKVFMFVNGISKEYTQ